MNNVFTLANAKEQVEALKLLHSAIPACVEATVKEVGIVGLQQFFDGYKNNIESYQHAA